jgi:hypothetical protein
MSRQLPRTWTSIVLAMLIAGLASCGGGGSASPPPPPTISVVVSPSTASLVVGGTQQFSATVSGTSNQGVTWSVNNVTSGNSTVGTISAQGVYTAPAVLPASGSQVTVGAASVADSTKTASATVSLSNPVPTVTSISPMVVAAGAPNTTITVTGGGFVPQSQINLNQTALTTTFITATQLSATIPSGSLANAGADEVTVVTPGPGGGTSPPASLAVTVVASLVILATPQNGGPTDGPWQVVVAAVDANGNSISNLPITLTSTDGTLDLTQGQTDSSGTFLATISPPGTNTGQAVAVTAATGAQTAVVNIGFLSSSSTLSAVAIAKKAFKVPSNNTSLSTASSPMFGSVVYGVAGNAGSTSPYSMPSNCFSNVGLTGVPSSECQTTFNASGLVRAEVNVESAACNTVNTVLGYVNCAGTAISAGACLTGVGAVLCAGGIAYFGLPCLKFVASQLASQFAGPLPVALKAGLAGLMVWADPGNPLNVIDVGCVVVDAASFGLGSGSSSSTQLSVSPPRAIVSLGGTQQFTANTSVSWSVVQGPMGGSITSTGLYTAPTTMPFIHEVTVDATSNTDSSAVAQEGVTLVNTAGGSSGSTAIIEGLAGGQLVDKAYVPVPNSYLVSVVNVDAAPGTNPVVDTIPTPNFYSPNATAANPTTQQVVTISYTSPEVQIIDGFNDRLVATLTSPVTQSTSFSGGSCVICGVAIDPTTNTAILDTSEGFLFLNLATQQFSSFVPGTVAAENFGYNPNSQIILSPTYGQFIGPALQAINVRSNAVYAFSSPIDNYLDSAAVDLNTNIAVVPDEYTGDQFLINMGQASFSAGGFSVPDTIVNTGFTNCVTYDATNEWTMVSIESSSHLLFLGTEFGDCAAVEPLPTTAISGAPPTPSFYDWGHMPSAPDGFGWDNGADPHGIAVFTSVVDGKAYGFLVRSDQAWVARIDLAGVVSAPPLAGGGPGQVDLTPYVVFLNTQ